MELPTRTPPLRPGVTSQQHRRMGVLMDQYEKNIIPQIESVYASLTSLEKNIADFFIKGPAIDDLSINSVAKHLFISEASLTRFAKKCGCKGYREFLFLYEQSHPRRIDPPISCTGSVLDAYQKILRRTYPLVDEVQMDRVAALFLKKKRIYVYGKGSSATAGIEMKLRFLQIGLNVDTISDIHLMKMNYLLLDEDCLVVGITESGRHEIASALRAAKKQGATTVLLTASRSPTAAEYCDEILLFAPKDSLDLDRVVSPQFPILVVLDVLLSHILESNRYKLNSIRESALRAVNDPN